MSSDDSNLEITFNGDLSSDEKPTDEDSFGNIDSIASFDSEEPPTIQDSRNKSTEQSQPPKQAAKKFSVIDFSAISTTNTQNTIEATQNMSKPSLQSSKSTKNESEKPVSLDLPPLFSDLEISSSSSHQDLMEPVPFSDKEEPLHSYSSSSKSEENNNMINFQSKPEDNVPISVDTNIFQVDDDADNSSDSFMNPTNTLQSYDTTTKESMKDEPEKQIELNIESDNDGNDQFEFPPIEETKPVDLLAVPDRKKKSSSILPTSFFSQVDNTNDEPMIKVHDSITDFLSKPVEPEPIEEEIKPEILKENTQIQPKEKKKKSSLSILPKSVISMQFDTQFKTQIDDPMVPPTPDKKEKEIIIKKEKSKKKERPPSPKAKEIKKEKKKIPEKTETEINLSDRDSDSTKKSEETELKEPLSSVSLPASEAEVVQRRMPMEVGIGNSIDSSFSTFRRLFLNEFRSLFVTHPNPFIYNDIQSYTESLTNEIKTTLNEQNRSAEYPIENSSRAITKMVDETIKDVEIMINNSARGENERKARHMQQLNELLSAVDDLHLSFKRSASTFMREIKYEKTDSISSDKNYFETEQQYRKLSLLHMELESKANRQVNELDLLLTQENQLLNKYNRRKNVSQATVINPIINTQIDQISHEMSLSSLEILSGRMIQLQNTIEEQKSSIQNEFSLIQNILPSYIKAKMDEKIEKKQQKPSSPKRKKKQVIEYSSSES